MKFQFSVTDINTQENTVLELSTDNRGFKKNFQFKDDILTSVTRFEEKLNNLEAEEGLITVYALLDDLANNPKHITCGLVDDDGELFGIVDGDYTSDDQVSFYGDLAPEQASDEVNIEKFMFVRALELK